MAKNWIKMTSLPDHQKGETILGGGVHSGSNGGLRWDREGEGEEGDPPNNQMWFCPLCVCWFIFRLRPLPHTQRGPTLTNDAIPHTHFLSPPVSQSEQNQYKSPFFFFGKRGKKNCSWNVLIMWCWVERRWVGTSGEHSLLLGQRQAVIWSHRGRRNREYKLIYWNPSCTLSILSAWCRVQRPNSVVASVRLSFMEIYSSAHFIPTN